MLHVAWYRYTVWKHSTWRRLGIHGPTPFPFLGSLKDVGTKVLCYLEYFSTQRNFLNILRPCVDRLPISLMVLEITSTKKGQQSKIPKFERSYLTFHFNAFYFCKRTILIDYWCTIHIFCYTIPKIGLKGPQFRIFTYLESTFNNWNIKTRQLSKIQ